MTLQPEKIIPTGDFYFFVCLISDIFGNIDRMKASNTLLKSSLQDACLVKNGNHHMHFNVNLSDFSVCQASLSMFGKLK